MGDTIRIEFKGKILEEELLRIDGVINYSIQNNLCEVIVDEGEKRLGPLIALFAQSGAQMTRVSLGQTDLEDVFIEFAKETDSDMGLCL